MKSLKQYLLPSFGFCLLLLCSFALHADSKKIADYPLRVHIFQRNETTFYHNRYEEEAKGEGRANLFENGEAHGVDFTFDCEQKLKSSFGYETYPAKWKKPGQSLTVLLPVFGKSNAYFTCELKTDVKDYAYGSREGKLRSESAATFKQWMINHNYDPEHDKNEPINVSKKPGAEIDVEPSGNPPQ